MSKTSAALLDCNLDKLIFATIGICYVWGKNETLNNILQLQTILLLLVVVIEIVLLLLLLLLLLFLFLLLLLLLY